MLKLSLFSTSYAGAFENPPLLIVSDIERTIVRTNWTNAVSACHEFHLDDVRDPVKRALLRSAWEEPDRFRVLLRRGKH